MVVEKRLTVPEPRLATTSVRPSGAMAAMAGRSPVGAVAMTLRAARSTTLTRLAPVETTKARWPVGSMAMDCGLRARGMVATTAFRTVSMTESEPCAWLGCELTT